MRARIVGTVVTLIAVVGWCRRLSAKLREVTHRYGDGARGRRYTTTIPAGAAGRNAPLVNTVEGWTALACQLIGLIVREARNDSRSGDTIRELTSLSQSEPDPATFPRLRATRS
jgi:hypothetical protein